MNNTISPLVITLARRMSRRRIRQMQRTMRLNRSRACLVARLLAVRPAAVIVLLFAALTLVGCGGTAGGSGSSGTGPGISPTPCAVASFDQGHDCAVIQFDDGSTYQQVGK